jgi:hypothetical protein
VSGIDWANGADDCFAAEREQAPSPQGPANIGKELLDDRRPIACLPLLDPVQIPLLYDNL